MAKIKLTDAYKLEIDKLQVEIEPVVRGTLTAEQVRKAIFAGSVYASYDGAQYYANGINMQAIADELNARAERTCEPTDCDSGEMDVDVYALSCGHVAYYPSVYEDTPSYCPECGAKVVDA